MAYDRFMIAPISDGIRTDLKPWLIPDSAWSEMFNAYVFRGRVRKRFGGKYTGSGWPSASVASMYSRLGMDLSLLITTLPGGAAVGITDGAGNATGTAPGLVWRLGQRFSIGAEIFTVITDTAPWVMATTGGTVTKTFNLDTGVYTFAGAAALTQIYFYPFGNTGDGVTSGAGTATGFVPGTKFKLGQQFTINNDFYTVVSAAAGQQDMIRTDGVAVVPGVNCWFNNTTGEYNIAGTPHVAATVYFYPSEPVMGITQFQEGPINDQPAFAWDTQFVYYYTGSWWEMFTPPIWHGADYNFFWATTWTGVLTSDPVLFVTNFNAVKNGAPGATDDPIWYYDGTDWDIFTPYFLPGGGAAGTGPYVQTARIILPFHGRLLLFNTIEGNAAGTVNTHYPSRCRFSHYGSPFSDVAWYEPNQADSTPGYADGGGWVDATTTEEIISAEFNKDRLIVYFERSTWEIAYTGNEIVPFQWLKINTELGADATFSRVSFDREVLAIGNTGVHACNSSNVVRIDEKIPDTIFGIRSVNQGRQRVAGIRDFWAEMVYWTYPSPTTSQHSRIYPNQVLVYNYKNQTWSFNEDSITAFGFFEQSLDTTWENSFATWQNAGFPWNSAVQRSDFRQIIAGNQEGFVFIVATEENRNAPVLQITNMEVVGGQVVALIVDSHNLEAPDYIKVEYAQGITALNGGIYQIYATSTTRIALFPAVTAAGIYTGGGVVSRVSNIRFKSKQWNPYVEKGMNCQLAKIDFLVDSTSAGAIAVEYQPNTSQVNLGDEAINSNSSYGVAGRDFYLETYPYLLRPMEFAQERLWHPLYFQGDGECIQLSFFLTDDMMRSVSTAESPFQLHAMILHTKPTASRLE